MLWLYLIGAILLIIGAAVLERSTRKEFSDRKRSLQSSVGKAVSPLTPTGPVKLGTELWQATTIDGATIDEGSTVKVVSVEGLKLKVEHLEDN